MSPDRVRGLAGVVAALVRAGLDPADALEGAAGLLGVAVGPEAVPFRGHLGRRARSLLGVPDRDDVVVPFRVPG